MSQEGSLSTSPQRSRPGFHGLRVHMLPTEPSDLKRSDSGIKTNHNRVDEDDQIEDEYSRGRPQSSFEVDEDFKFKRRKRKDGALGDRFDSLQDVQQAKWMDNFNSSIQHSQFGSLPMSHVDNSQPQPQPQASMMAAPQFMPYMYYYPMAPPMLPVHTSPQRHSNVPSSVQGYPNTSTQPFYPHLGHTMNSSQLLPPPPPHMYPSSYYPHGTKDQLQATDRRRSIPSKRGHRLSMLSFHGDENGGTVVRSEVVSPHKDVPESDFYRHIANTSFGRGLQTRQLFNWCIIRCLRKLELQEEQASANENAPSYINPRRISMVILREFVQDLRKGKIDIDWDGKNIRDTEPNSDDTEDTVLRELFDDDNDEDNSTSFPPRTVARRKHSTIKIPNEKNIQNLENLRILEEKISKLRAEMQQWSEALDDEKYQTNWKALRLHDINSIDIEVEPQSYIQSEDAIRLECTQRLDALRGSYHLLLSHAKLLNDTLRLKAKDISKELSSLRASSKPVEDKQYTKKLLLGLSKAITAAEQHALPNGS